MYLKRKVPQKRCPASNFWKEYICFANSFCCRLSFSYASARHLPFQLFAISAFRPKSGLRSCANKLTLALHTVGFITWKKQVEKPPKKTKIELTTILPLSNAPGFQEPLFWGWMMNLARSLVPAVTLCQQQCFRKDQLCTTSKWFSKQATCHVWSREHYMVI